MVDLARTSYTNQKQQQHIHALHRWVRCSSLFWLAFIGFSYVWSTNVEAANGKCKALGMALGRLLQSYSVRVKAMSVRWNHRAISVLFYGKNIFTRQAANWSKRHFLNANLKTVLTGPSNIVRNVYDIKVIGVAIFNFQIGNIDASKLVLVIASYSTLSRLWWVVHTHVLWYITVQVCAALLNRSRLVNVGLIIIIFQS